MDEPTQPASKATEEVERTDREVARSVGSARKTSLVKALGTVSELSDQPPLIAASAMTIVAGLVVGNRRLARTGMRMLASHLLATKVKSMIKERIDRTRPFVMLSGDGYHARKGDSDEKAETSFPSGHTAGAFAIACAVASEYPGSRPIGYTAATAAGAIQIPRGTHYLSDVIVGAAIGIGAELLVRLVLPTAAGHAED